MKKNLISKFLILSILLVSILGININISKADVVLPEMSRVVSTNFDGKQMRETLPSGVFPKT